MKSENILLSCCVFFILMCVVGLTAQSCRTTRQNSHATTTENVSGYKRIESVRDTTSLTALIKNWQDRFTITTRRFVPVVDSSGHVSSALLEETVYNRDKMQSESDIRSDTGTTINNHQDSVSKQSEIESESECEKQGFVSAKKIIPSIVVLILIGFFVYRIRKYFGT